MPARLHRDMAGEKFMDTDRRDPVKVVMTANTFHSYTHVPFLSSTAFSASPALLNTTKPKPGGLLKDRDIPTDDSVANSCLVNTVKAMESF